MSAQTKLDLVIQDIKNTKALSGILYGLMKIEPLALDLKSIALHGELMRTAMEGVDHEYDTAIAMLQEVVERGAHEYPEEIWVFIQASTTGVSWSQCRDTIMFIKRSVYSGSPGSIDEIRYLRAIANLLEDLQYDVPPSMMQPKIIKLIDDIWK